MSLEHLDSEHLEPLKRALNNLLSTTIVEQTYAQIVDGMPIASVYAEDHWFREGNPLMQHEELCPGVLEKTRNFRSQFDVLSLEFPPKAEMTCPGKLCYSCTYCEATLSTQTLQAYQDTKLGSAAWKLRLLELVVIACHDIAAHLYQLDEGVHKHAEWADWRSERLARLPKGARGQEVTKCGPPVLFFASKYKDPERFSNGLADVVGYWAELRTFGGVVLFDRGQTEEEVSEQIYPTLHGWNQARSGGWDKRSLPGVSHGLSLILRAAEQCNGIYIHSSSPTTLAPPTEKQFNDLVDLLVSKSPDPALCPLPIEITLENKWRWEVYRGMAEYHIYKYRQEIPKPRRHTRCDASRCSSLCCEAFPVPPCLRNLIRPAFSFLPFSRLFQTPRLRRVKRVIKAQPTAKATSYCYVP